MCGLKPSAQASAGNATSENDGITVNDQITVSDEITAEATGDGITILATSSADVADERAAGHQSADESSPSAATTSQTSLQSPSMTKPCPADCSAGTTSVVRQPRPREAALPAHGSRRTLPEQSNWKPHSHDIDPAAGATLKRARPRGPPLSS
jgi:hypothetical protein